MKKGMIGLLIILAIIAIIVFSAIGSYNGMAKAREAVDASFGNVQTVYQRRADLIPNLVNTVKGYSQHELDVLTKVTEAREGITGATTPEQLTAAGDQLNDVIRSINVTVEAYPDLKADATYIQLMDELAGTENRINTARTDFNESVKAYNSKIISFPANIIAGIFNFEKADYFDAAEGSDVAPPVQF